MNLTGAELTGSGRTSERAAPIMQLDKWERADWGRRQCCCAPQPSGSKFRGGRLAS